jgi:hypothetical protein
MGSELEPITWSKSASLVGVMHSVRLQLWHGGYNIIYDLLTVD